jgi:hypothetical protein
MIGEDFFFPGNPFLSKKELEMDEDLKRAIEDVARSWWGPSASRANGPLLLTAYVNLDD